MQYLRVIAIPTPDGQFDVYWTNTVLESVRGIAHVNVAQVDDRAIIAELHALQYLLEIEEVIGANLAGGDTIKLVVSSGAIKKLARKSSAKQTLVEHAKFMTTRFHGCQIEVEKDTNWTANQPEQVKCIALDASEPLEESIVVNGLGEVSITAHVVERFAEHLAEERATHYSIGEAWRLLRSMAGDSKVHEINKSSGKSRIKYALKGMQEGRYFVHPVKKWVFVCTKYEHQKRMALVTAYPHND